MFPKLLKGFKEKNIDRDELNPPLSRLRPLHGAPKLKINLVWKYIDDGEETSLLVRFSALKMLQKLKSKVLLFG